MTRRHALATVLLTLASVGCATFRSFDKTNTLHQRDIAARATFDLDCPAAELHFTSLDSPSKQVPRKWGVRGCGRKATYVNLEERDLDVPGNWVLESEVSSGS